MKIAVIGALAEEIAFITAGLSEVVTQTEAHIQYHVGQFAAHMVVVAQPGIGKVNAVLGVANIKQHFAPDVLINTGSAGSLSSKLAIGDVVIADQLAYHDVDNRVWGYQFGQVPQMPAYYAVDAQWVGLAPQLAASISDFAIHVGLITSGESFIADDQQRTQIKHHFSQVQAVDMESCAIAQACYTLQQPYVVIRAISDTANDAAAQNHEANLKLSCRHAAQSVLALLGII